MTEPGHQYTKDPKFKHNQNARPVRVGRRVFNSVTAAETFCTRHDKDVNHDIEWEPTQEFRDAAMETAKTQKAILRELKERMERHLDELNQQRELALAEYEESKRTRDLSRGYKEQRFTELSSKSQECYTSLEIITKLLFELEEITGWHD